jgi:diadenosine tetraphosphate (Ap4A) HIT family hydrolase
LKFDDNCIFCKIIQKQAPSSIIYEDASVMAFLDIRPTSEGHTLVISKDHYEDIFDIPSELLGKVHQIVKTVANAAKQGMNADGICVIQQNGKAANQEIFHLHVHIIPRYNGQKMKMGHELQAADFKQLDLTATKIRQCLQAGS